MDIKGFSRYLNKDKRKAYTYILFIKAMEEKYNINIDEELKTDMGFYRCLILARELDISKCKSNIRQNCLRKYYMYHTGRRFPRLADFEKANRLPRITRIGREFRGILERGKSDGCSTVKEAIALESARYMEEKGVEGVVEYLQHLEDLRVLYRIKKLDSIQMILEEEDED